LKSAPEHVFIVEQRYIKYPTFTFYVFWSIDLAAFVRKNVSV